ncbi:MAG TPA: LysM peptidoglycan-binding domain-containing protein [Verrucomicrobiae bacterium]|nr:LysM peptidoglycan-binding domain-containing protein [Verrucomicrobiae bacterium]
MMFQARSLYAIALALTCLALAGCNPSGPGQQDEEKEPHFLAGKNRANAYDFKGAVQCFEKALQVNPQSSAAHFELAWIYDQRESDPAAAIYHYQHYLNLQPKAQNSDLARQRIMSCKQALAETVTLGPVTEKLQKQFEQLSQENKRLTDDNKRLKEDLEKWAGYAARLQALTNQPAPVASSPQPILPVRQDSTPILVMSKPSPAASQPTSPATNRTHTIKAGETPSLIARKYGLKVDALMSANPGLDARRLRVGQVLRIPGS